MKTDPVSTDWQIFLACLDRRTADWTPADYELRFASPIAFGSVPDVLRAAYIEALQLIGWTLDQAEASYEENEPAILAVFRKPPQAQVIRLDDYRNPPRQLDLVRNYEIAGRSGDAEHLRPRAR